MGYNYRVFSFVLREETQESVPVGVAMWSEDHSWSDIRLLNSGDKLRRLSDMRSRALVDSTKKRLGRWLKDGQLAGLKSEVATSQSAWWSQASKLLVHSVRLGPECAIDVTEDREHDLDLLFESLVGPYRLSLRERRHKLATVVGECLGELADRFCEKTKIVGFGERDIEVMHSYRGVKGYVIVEGVNISGSGAEAEIDATTSRLQRLRAGPRGGEIRGIVVGYLPSAHGLNGEAALVDWCTQQTNAQIYDLRTQADELQHATRELIDAANGQLIADAE
ncbi:MAG: DUF3037 domain-containing protein [Polyangiales bacterium]